MSNDDHGRQSSREKTNSVDAGRHDDAADRYRREDARERRWWVAFAFVLLGSCVAIVNLVGEAEPTDYSDEPQEQTAETEDSESGRTGVAAQGDEVTADAPAPTPISALLANNDPHACSSPQAEDGLITTLMQNVGKAGEAAESVLPTVQMDASTFTATAVDERIHTVSCSANVTVQIGDAPGKSFAVDFELSPSLEDDAEAIISVNRLTMSAPIGYIRNAIENVAIIEMFKGNQNVVAEELSGQTER